WYGAHRDRPSFPTRRSSDLGSAGEGSGVGFARLPHARLAEHDEGGTGHGPEHAHDAVEEQRRLGDLGPDRLVDRPEESGDREARSEEHTSELQSRENLVCRL